MCNPSSLVVIVPDAIKLDYVRGPFWAALSSLILSLDLPEAEGLARVQREMATVAALPREMQVVMSVPGVGDVQATVHDCSVIYGIIVLARTAIEESEGVYLEHIRNWIDAAVKRKARADGASMLPFFGAAVKSEESAHVQSGAGRKPTTAHHIEN